jgi:hypothetical protein
MIGLTFKNFNWKYKGEFSCLPQDGQRLIEFLEDAFINEIQSALIKDWKNGAEEKAFMMWAKSCLDCMFRTGKNVIWNCITIHSSPDRTKTDLLTKAYNSNNYEVVYNLLRGFNDRG